MTTIIFILLVLALICMISKRKKMAFWFVIVSIFLIFLGGTTFYPKWLLSQLHVRSDVPIDKKINWTGKEAIVLLGAGTVLTEGPTANEKVMTPGIATFGRIVKLMELYNDCQASKVSRCLIILSGGDPLHHGESEAIVNYRILKSLGVKDNDVILEDKSKNTFQNVEFITPILQRYEIEKAYVVTSDFHLKRSLMFFNNFGVKTAAVPAGSIPPRGSFIPESWNLTVTDILLGEFKGIAQYHIYNFMGWNKKKEN